jgi:Zn-dependent peptidase ImmA (M78 family)
MDWLYVFCDEDFDRLAEYVGAAESVAEFMQKTQTLIDSTVTDRDVFVQKADKMWKAKEEWRTTTAQLAQEILE